jgi:hypothetical protein
MIVYVRARQRYTQIGMFGKMLKELDVGNTEDTEGICALIYSLLFHMIVHNGGPLWRGQRQTVEKLILSESPLMNRQPTVAV